MNKKEQINTAIKAVDKYMTYEDLYYSDYMYGKEDFTDAVWVYVVEIKEDGMRWFTTYYSDYI